MRETYHYLKRFTQSDFIKIMILLFGMSIINSTNSYSQQLTQQSSQNELLNDIKNAKNDSTKYKSIENYGKWWFTRNTDSCLKYYKYGQKLAVKSKNPLLYIQSLRVLSAIYQARGNYQEMKANGEELIRFSLKNKDIDGQIMGYLATGTAAQSLGDIQQYLDDHLKAQKICEQYDKLLKYPNIPYNIGGALNVMGQPQKALPYYYESIELCKKAKHDLYLSVSYFNLATYFSTLSKFDSALAYHEKSLKICQKINYDQAISMNLAELSATSYKLKQFQKGLKYANLALNDAEKSNYVIGKVNGLFGLSQNYAGLNNINKAVNYGENAFAIIQANKLDGDFYGYYEFLSEINAKNGNHKKAYFYLGKFKEWEDSVSNTEVKTKISLIETQYSTAKKEKQILSLQKEKLLQNLDLQQRNIWLYILAISLVSLSIIGFQFYRNTTRQALLNTQSLEIQDQKIKELEQEKQLTAVSSIIQGQEEERSRLARDLHDGLGGLLSGIKLTLNNMTGNVILSEQNANSFTRALGQLDNAISEMRRVAHSMMPEALLKFGLKDALNDFCEGISHAGKIKVHFQSYNFEKRLDQTVEVTIYRIIQELLNNTLKHAEATEVFVQLNQDDQHLTISVEDNGKGFDIHKLNEAKGIGIQNVENRVAYLNGKIDIQSSEGKGTLTLIEIENT
jgi:two-component system, NarL family, sensor kinase